MPFWAIWESSFLYTSRINRCLHLHSASTDVTLRIEDSPALIPTPQAPLPSTSTHFFRPPPPVTTLSLPRKRACVNIGVWVVDNVPMPGAGMVRYANSLGTSTLRLIPNFHHALCIKTWCVFETDMQWRRDRWGDKSRSRVKTYLPPEQPHQRDL